MYYYLNHRVILESDASSIMQRVAIKVRHLALLIAKSVTVSETT